jgi:hypothetical protein
MIIRASRHFAWGEIWNNVYSLLYKYFAHGIPDILTIVRIPE